MDRGGAGRRGRGRRSRPARGVRRLDRGVRPAKAPTGCSDVVVTGTRTTDGHLLVAHTNDLYAEDESGIVAIEWRVPGQPVVFTLGSGPWISVGWNDAGLSVTGNEVSPNDERVGIPRLLQVRDVLTRAHADRGDRRQPAPRPRVRLQLGVRPRRRERRERRGLGDERPHGRARRGRLPAHTNHYARDEMQPSRARGTRRAPARDSTARASSRAAAPSPSNGSAQVLSDHENGENAICRHGEEPKAVKTVFWCVADVTAGEITYGRGNPCDSEAQVYRFTAVIAATSSAGRSPTAARSASRRRPARTRAARTSSAASSGGRRRATGSSSASTCSPATTSSPATRATAPPTSTRCSPTRRWTSSSASRAATARRRRSRTSTST